MVSALRRTSYSRVKGDRFSYLTSSIALPSGRSAAMLTPVEVRCFLRFLILAKISNRKGEEMGCAGCFLGEWFAPKSMLDSLHMHADDTLGH